MRDERIVGSSTLHVVSLAVMLFGFWLLLSGSLQTKFLIYGVLTACVAACASYPLLLIGSHDGTKKFFIFGVSPVKLIGYFFWLMWQLILANVDVLRATVRPEIEIAPRVVKFRFVTENPMAQVILANSITLTPGTVTMDVTEDGVFTVHALTDGAAEGLMDPAGMPGKVAWLLGEEFTFELIGEED